MVLVGLKETKQLNEDREIDEREIGEHGLDSKESEMMSGRAELT